MKLMAENGQEVARITCDLFDSVDVVTLDTTGEQVVTDTARARIIKPGIFKGVPDNCPYTQPASNRQLGHFAACTECIYATRFFKSEV
jgi:hypothetical protein